METSPFKPLFASPFEAARIDTEKLVQEAKDKYDRSKSKSKEKKENST